MAKFSFSPKGPLIGITGSSGSGKTLVGDYLKSQGYAVINFDEVRQTVIEQPEVKTQLLRQFGSVNPKVLRGLIGKDPQKSLLLSQLVAVPSLIKTMNLTNEFFDKNQEVVFWEGSKMVETKTYQTLKGLILVTAPQDDKINRLQTRDEVSLEYVQSIMKEELTDEEKIQSLTSFPKLLVLDNSKTKEEFGQELLKIDSFIKSVLAKA